MVYSIMAFVGLVVVVFSSLTLMFAEGSQKKDITVVMIMGAIVMVVAFVMPIMQSRPVSLQVADLLNVEESSVIVEDLTEDSGFLGLGPQRNGHLRRVHVDGKTYLAELNGLNVEKITEQEPSR